MAEIKTIGVVGAGIMGAGIAQVAAQAGYQVVMRDIEDRFVEKGLASIKKGIGRLVEKGKMAQDEADAILSRIKGTTDLNDLKEADYVCEAIIEQLEAKQELYRQLDGICRPEVIFASNTSGLSITAMAAATQRPDKVVGMHFFNPVPLMKLVELIKGADTSEETFATARELAIKWGKEPITVNEAPLFAVNRILCPMINEAIFVLQEGIASAEDIDKGLKLGASHPIGPLALADLIGLDTLLFVIETLYRETGDSKYRPAPLLRKMVRAGRLGRKTGRGFYDYTQK